jgi:argininosuccinate synthase
MKLKMSEIWKVVVVALVVTTTACGQQRVQRGGQQGLPEIPNTKQIERMVSNLADEISLSKEQEANILELYTAHFKEVKEKTKSGRPDRKEMELLRTDFEKGVKAVLTGEQHELYDAYQKKNRPQGRK